MRNFLKPPDLEYNSFYPFYTRKDTGKKKSFYKTETIMHLSDSRAILIARHYQNGKITALNIEMKSNAETLRQLRKESKLITYADFAKEVQTAYILLSRFSKKLAKATPFKLDFYETVYFKNDLSVYFEFDRERFNVLFHSGISKSPAAQEIDSALFDKQLNETWDAFTEYFKCPKYINKTAYNPTSKN